MTNGMAAFSPPPPWLLALALLTSLASASPAGSRQSYSSVTLDGRAKSHGGPAETCPQLTYCTCRRTRSSGGLDITCDKINRYKLQVSLLSPCVHTLRTSRVLRESSLYTYLCIMLITGGYGHHQDEREKHSLL